MSEANSAANRKREIIGCNIRRGFTPGGFSHYFGDKSHAGRKKRVVSAENVKAAATEALIKRGVVVQGFDDFTPTRQPQQATPCSSPSPQSFSDLPPSHSLSSS